MLIAKEFVFYLSRQLIKRLSPQLIETADPAGAAEFIANIITDELSAEDRLNDEVREMTRRVELLASVLINDSVIPSLR